MFDDIRLPIDVERGAQGGPGFRTSVITLSSGAEQRNREWQVARGRWNVGYGIRKRKDLDDVYAFFLARQGRYRAFRFRDWLDYTMAAEPVGIIPGIDNDVRRQIIKTYTSGAGVYVRPIHAPVWAETRVYVNGIETHDYIYEGGGIIRFPEDPGPNVHVTGEFDCIARFDTDDLGVTLNTYREGSIAHIPIIEIKFDLYDFLPQGVMLGAAITNATTMSIDLTVEEQPVPSDGAIVAGRYQLGQQTWEEAIGYSQANRNFDTTTSFGEQIGTIYPPNPVLQLCFAGIIPGSGVYLELNGDSVAGLNDLTLTIDGVFYPVKDADSITPQSEPYPSTLVRWSSPFFFEESETYPISLAVRTPPPNEATITTANLPQPGYDVNGYAAAERWEEGSPQYGSITGGIAAPYTIASIYIRQTNTLSMSIYGHHEDDLTGMVLSINGRRFPMDDVMWAFNDVAPDGVTELTRIEWWVDGFPAIFTKDQTIYVTFE